MIRVLLVDDQELVRTGFAALVSAEEDMEVCGHAANGHEAIDQAVMTRPDVILMDVRMPDMDGIAATARITSTAGLETSRVIVLTTFDLDQYVYGALRAGASGFLLKDTAPAALLEAIRVVDAGDALIAPSITRRLISEFASRPEPGRSADILERLTGREREVFAAVGRGLSNAEIAGELFISPLTAKTHVSRILTKLDARDRAQVVALAYESGVVQPGRSPDR